MSLLKENKFSAVKNTGIIELLRFDQPSIESKHFDTIFSAIKQADFYTFSKAYLRHQSPAIKAEEFGNYNLGEISGNDFRPIPFSMFIKDLSFIEPGSPGVETKKYEIIQTGSPTKKISAGEVNKTIIDFVTNEIDDSVNIYQLDTSSFNNEKFAKSGIWENFRHFIGVDMINKFVFLITAGKDLSIVDRFSAILLYASIN